VHWHQPHTFSELTRAGLSVSIGPDAQRAAWYVGEQRCTGTIDQRDELARRGWDAFVDGVADALPLPHQPLHRLDTLARFDRLTIAQRLDQLALSDEERAILSAELESLAHAPLAQAGAVAVLRWHALSGYGLWLTQQTGGRVTIDGGTGALLSAIAGGAPFSVRLSEPVAAVAQQDRRVCVTTRAGETLAARAAIVAVALNTLRAIDFDPGLPADKRAGIALGQASRGIKLMIRAEGDHVTQNVVRQGHEFGYLASEQQLGADAQLLIGFGPDAERLRADDLGAVQRSLETIMPGYRAVDATSHDWLADEFSRGTWAIHRPGWYEHHHAAMLRPEGRVLLAGSDLANGWAGFIDGAIESGVRAGAWAASVAVD
jgi:hypothetical protein